MPRSARKPKVKMQMRFERKRGWVMKLRMIIFGAALAWGMAAPGAEVEAGDFRKPLDPPRPVRVVG